MHRRAIILLLSIAAVSFASSCLKEDAFITQTDEMEGVPTMLTLSVNMNEMQGLTRAAMSDANANRVNSLWVGIYNASTGNCTYNNLFTREQIGNPGNHTLATLPTISTKSGVSYIVAVANAEDNYGITDNADLKESAGLADTRGGELSTLLAKADTWEKYKSISLMLTDPSNVDFSGSNNLAMSGSYYEKKDADPVSWCDVNGNPETVYISSNEAKLPGCIHLRRMISYIKFNIAAGENITIEPVSWKVFNTPIIAYLQEQTANSADVSEYFTGRDGYATNHGESNLSYDFTHGSFTKATGEAITDINGAVEGDSFDFYQFENKQTAIGFNDLGEGDYTGINENSQSPYSDREREWKKVDDGSNTGVYKSLSHSAENVDKNNYATYVTFRLKVTYWVMLDEANENTIGTETPVAPGTAGAIRREGYADYTVHLGYIEGESNLKKAGDFNCRRNMKYTYNVTVNSLNSIIVEAFNNGENQPGAEGDVTDVRNTGRIELDSHYAVFNIQLSYAERAALKWMIDAPYNDVSYSYYADDYRTGGVNAGYDLNNDQFYTWIRFKPTTDATTLRVYNDGGTDGIGWTLEELADPENHPGVDADGNNVTYDQTSTDQLWYTVFIDEYVYHKNEKGESTDVEDGDRGIVEGNWWAYVNQEPRIVWIACNNRHVSNDRESMYLNSKYMISQNSILTYYSSDVQTPNNTALGMERENETFGLNLAWSQTAWGELTANADNGRYNVWYYLSGRNTSSTTSTTGRGWSSVAKTKTKRIAGKVVNCCEQFSRDAINTAQLAETESKTARVFMPAAINGNIYTADRTGRDTYNPDPDGAHYEVLTACMSRNRDENGDGIIDAGEMKWYVPTTGKYARIILGRAVIPQSQRLMNFDITPAYGLDGKRGNSDHNTRFHFASSDKKVVWAEEGTSISDWYQGDWEYGAWEVRCVRNLGVNMGRVINNDPVTPAYTYEDNIFTLRYYEDGCKRAPQSTHLPAHDVQSSINQPAYQFEVAAARCNSTNTTGIDANSGLTLTANGALNGYSETAWKEACDNNYICGRYSQETGGADLGSWRVPNQKELVMMRRQGLLTGNNNVDGYFSCTLEHFTKTGKTEKRFFMFYPNRGTIIPDGTYHVRCVRDVMNN